MEPRLERETEQLRQAWERHDASLLGNYLVEDVEDPRINVQSILTRHFLLEELLGRRFQPLQEQELRFALVANWLLKLFRSGAGSDEVAALLHALGRGADDAEGIPVPGFVLQAFAQFPKSAEAARPVQLGLGESAADGPQLVAVPNYVARLLLEADCSGSPSRLSQSSLNTFLELWATILARESPPRLSVLEPACGSANDYRALEASGLARCLDYQGLDLSEKNIANARALFPNARFGIGNAFALPAKDHSVDCLFVHDLFEHLSMPGLDRALLEVCRVTRRAFCLGFFNMDEGADHVVQPLAPYHWNTLSLSRVREPLEAHGFATQAIHIDTYLSCRFGCSETHNKNAYTIIGRARASANPKSECRNPTGNPKTEIRNPTIPLSGTKTEVRNP